MSLRIIVPISKRLERFFRAEPGTSRWDYFFGKSEVPIPTVRMVERPARNYSPNALARAHALYPKAFIDVLKQIGMDNDAVFLARLRTIPVAIASQSVMLGWPSPQRRRKSTMICSMRIPSS